MAAKSHGTLEAATVATVTVTAAKATGAVNQIGLPAIEVLNRSGSAEIYFTVNGADPTVGGEDCHVLPAAVCALSVPGVGSPVTVKLISVGTPTYSVIGG